MGLTPVGGGLFGGTGFVSGRVGVDSVFSVLFREGDRLFGDELFADLFGVRGRRCVPPRVVATVMVLQRWFGLSDREAVAAFEFDLRWKYAAGGLPFDYGGFCHTVLVGMRARLAASERPRRVFDATLEAAREAGLVGSRRVLDSTPVYDAVAAQDTVTLLRGAVRGLLGAADEGLEAELRGCLVRDDDYVSSGKPECDWEDAGAREGLVAALAVDGFACLRVVEGRVVADAVADAAELLATVLGQDLVVGVDGRFRIARRVAEDRVISVVDTDTRHGRKTSSRRFDGYKGHIAVDPDSEIITNTVVTPANRADSSAAVELIGDLAGDGPVTGDGGTAPVAESGDPAGDGPDAGGVGEFEGRPTVYGDSAYGGGEFQQYLEDHRINSVCRTPEPTAPGGLFTKTRFDINLEEGTVTCPNEVTVVIKRNRKGEGVASWGKACGDCPLSGRCTRARGGRTIRIGRHEAVLSKARQRQKTRVWRHNYRATRPKVERKIAHLMRRRHGGRQTRMRGSPKVDADFNLLAAAVNLTRLAALGAL